MSLGSPERDAVNGLDIACNRKARKWTPGELAWRILWEYAGALLFAAVPRPFWGVRRALLRLFGARVAGHANICPSVRIAVPWNLAMGEYAAIGDRAIIYNLGLVTIGSKATISQGAHLCGGTHDHRLSDFPLVKAPITIGEGAWICADAFVGPGVTIGDLAILGARTVAMKDVGAREIVAGNPARRIGHRSLARDC
jgi:putative colanic acid biosynthesis acetyltransferase WcaF